MSFPTDYLKSQIDRYDEPRTSDAEDRLAELHALRNKLGSMNLVATRACDPFAGQIARVQIDVYGGSAAEIEATLLEYGTRCDAASQASEVEYGRCVIERNLENDWGTAFSWRGRLTLTPKGHKRPTVQTGPASLDIGLER